MMRYEWLILVLVLLACSCREEGDSGVSPQTTGGEDRVNESSAPSINDWDERRIDKATLRVACWQTMANDMAAGERDSRRTAGHYAWMALACQECFAGVEPEDVNRIFSGPEFDHYEPCMRKCAEIVGKVWFQYQGSSTDLRKTEASIRAQLKGYRDGKNPF